MANFWGLPRWLYPNKSCAFSLGYVVPRYGFNLATLSLAFSPDATLEPLGARAMSISQEIPKADGQPQENHRSKQVIFQQVMELISGGYEKSEFNGLVSKSRGNFLPVDLV